jgi:protein transport protein SEC61 subunit beta
MVRVELIPESLRIGSGAPFDFYFWGRLAPPPRGSWAYWVSTWAKCVVALARLGISFYAIHSLPERENKLHLIIFLVFRINPAFPAFELIRRNFELMFNPPHCYIIYFLAGCFSRPLQAQARKATAGRGAGGGGRAAGGSSNILQFYTDDSPGLQVGPTTVLVASLSFVGVVVLLHIWGKFRM